MRRSTLASITLISITVAGTVYGFYCHRLFYHDDAFISLRYVYNFLHGQGLVWNPGERIEGYSSFLMVILTSLLGRLGINLITATRVIGILSFAGLVTVVFLWSRQLCRQAGTAISLVAPMMTATALPLIAWSVGGLETALFTLFLTLACWMVTSAADGGWRPATTAGLALGLAAMTRPEGLVYAGLAVAFLSIGAVRKTSKWTPVMWCAGVTLAMYLPLLIWRINYYGDFVPNPVHAKASMSLAKTLLGALYVGKYSYSLPLLVPLAAAAAIAAKVWGRWTREMSLLSLLVVVHLLMVVMVGGDHMPAFRFIVPIIPALALMIGFGVANFRPRLQIASVAVAALLTIGQLAMPAPTVLGARVEDGAAFLGRIIGEWINTAFPRGSLVALNTAGSTPYYAPNLRFIDMLGITDRTIACRQNIPKVAAYQWVPGHEKGDGAYVLSRQPDFIIAGGSIGYTIDTHWFVSEYELARIPEFRERYKPDGVMMSTNIYDGYRNYRESAKGEMPFRFYHRQVSKP